METTINVALFTCYLAFSLMLIAMSVFIFVGSYKFYKTDLAAWLAALFAALPLPGTALFPFILVSYISMSGGLFLLYQIVTDNPLFKI